MRLEFKLLVPAIMATACYVITQLGYGDCSREFYCYSLCTGWIFASHIFFEKGHNYKKGGIIQIDEHSFDKPAVRMVLESDFSELKDSDDVVFHVDKNVNLRNEFEDSDIL